MFFRVKKSPSGQCLQLLESYRNAQGEPRHRVVVSLGDAQIGEPERPLIARLVEQRLYGQQELLPAKASDGALNWVDCILKRIDREGRWHPFAATNDSSSDGECVIENVLASKVSHTHTTPLGPSLVGWEAWQRLQMPQKLEALGFNTAQAQAAAVSVINRLVDPGSELALVDWLPDSSLPELMGMEIAQAGKDRFYRISDRLLEHQGALEEHLRQRQGELFEVDRTLLLYDLTNSYFEGEAKGNPKAKRGKSKEKRNDCPQVVLGMVFDRRGFELAHRVFEGNQSDGKSLIDMIEQMIKLVPDLWQKAPLVLLDGGIATQANLALLRDKKFHYLVNDSRRGRSAYRNEFLEEDKFAPIQEREGKSEVRVRKLVDPLWSAPQQEALRATGEPATEVDHAKEPSAADTLVLCWSQGREQKESAICSAAEKKYLEGLNKVALRVSQGKLQDQQKIQRAIGRLQQKHSRIQRFYQVEITEQGQGKQLTWTRMEQKHQADQDLLGCYVLRTDLGESSAQDIWKLYMTLSKAEDGFRCLKGDLGLRPNYHQTEGRVEGHIWITILAYHLLCWIQETLEQSGDTRRWGTLRRILQTHCYTTIILPTKGGKVYRIRKAGEPEELQKKIYEKLKINWNGVPRATEPAEGKSIL